MDESSLEFTGKSEERQSCSRGTVMAEIPEGRCWNLANKDRKLIVENNIENAYSVQRKDRQFEIKRLTS